MNINQVKNEEVLQEYWGKAEMADPPESDDNERSTSSYLPESMPLDPYKKVLQSLLSANMHAMPRHDQLYRQKLVQGALELLNGCLEDSQMVDLRGGWREQANEQGVDLKKAKEILDLLEIMENAIASNA